MVSGASALRADELHSDIWNRIGTMIDRTRARPEIRFGKVVRRDERRRLVWLEDYGDLAIPLVAFHFGFSYYDTDETGQPQLRSDPSGDNTSYQTKLLVPKVGERVVILDSGGAKRFPFCVGVIQSSEYWQGEDV
jgi:hypothetical protein